MSGGFGSNTISHVQRKEQMLTLKKRGLGSPTISGDAASWCSIVDNGTGDYTIQFTKAPFTQVPVVMAQPVTPGTATAITAMTALECTVEVTDLAGVAAEGDFDLVIVGSLATDLIGV